MLPLHRGDLPAHRWHLAPLAGKETPPAAQRLPELTQLGRDPQRPDRSGVEEGRMKGDDLTDPPMATYDPTTMEVTCPKNHSTLLMEGFDPA